MFFVNNHTFWSILLGIIANIHNEKTITIWVSFEPNFLVKSGTVTLSN